MACPYADYFTASKGEGLLPRVFLRPPAAHLFFARDPHPRTQKMIHFSSVLRSLGEVEKQVP
jgi:hypothetical protein